tara:strand:- start:237 stop:389 length:153 start_codon:yes stop_codon:yes gene_type:complete
MMEDLLEMLETIKKNKVTGRYIGIALGDHKYPHTYKEGVKLLRRTLWIKK